MFHYLYAHVSLSLLNRHSYYFSKLLKDWRPRYVVLYDPNVNCVRQLEIHKSLNPGIPLRVYVLFYDSSVEEQVSAVGCCVVLSWEPCGRVSEVPPHQKLVLEFCC